MVDPNECPDFVDSDIDIPQFMPSDPNPHGSLDSIGAVGFAGVGTGAEYLDSDGSVYTRAKTSGGGGGNSPAPAPAPEP